MKNRDLFLKPPGTFDLLNNGVAKVADIRTAEQLKTLRYELSTFVCDGQYAKGLYRILHAYLGNLDKPEQPAVWVSGFYGSGKSHLVKMLQYLWTDFTFPEDGATAHGLAKLPPEVAEQFKELKTRGKQMGGLHAAAGTLGAGAGDSVRLALLNIVFRSAGLPEEYPLARFVLWLKREGHLDAVRSAVEGAGRKWLEELRHLHVSDHLAKALLAANTGFANSPADAKSLLKSQFPRKDDVSDAEMFAAVHDALDVGGKLPGTLIVLDEVQQYINESTDRSYKVQEVAEACAKHFGGRLLLVGTGQTALTGTPSLQRLRHRFTVSIELSDQDVETVTREIVLKKKPDKVPAVASLVSACGGEVSRHLTNTRIAPAAEDADYLVPDYPLLPTRRRFWEKVLRAVDRAGTSGQLRTQLKIVYEAVRGTADEAVGTVVPGDFIYDQIATEMIQTGVLLREVAERVAKLKAGGKDDQLRARLYALVFLINKLPREGGSDDGVRATPDVLADLIVSDLKAGSAELRKQIPELLKDLVVKGHLMQVDAEYRVQTRESSAWDNDYRDRVSKLLNNEQTLADERNDLLRQEVGERLKGIKVQHGKSKVPRKIDLHFAQDPPQPTGQSIPVWVTDGWTLDERIVLAEARRSATDSPVVYVHVPKRSAADLDKTLAGWKAADQTLGYKGVPATPEGIEAREAMKTRVETEHTQLLNLVNDVLGGARVYQAGGAELTGIALPEIVREATNASLARLYPNFDVADDPKWEKVLERAKKGDGDALAAVGHKGDPETHPVCAGVLSFIAAGKSGIEIRKHFGSSPFGWPQDATDGALMALANAGHLAATMNGVALDPKELDQKKIGIADFRLVKVKVGAAHRIAARAVFQAVGVPFKPNEEAAAVGPLIAEARSRAESAGGDPPSPPRPDVKHLNDLAGLSPNEQVLFLHEHKDRLIDEAAKWRKAGETIVKRKPRWQALGRLLRHGEKLSAADEVRPQAEAIVANRSLLAEPDPVPALADHLAEALRQALTAAHDQYQATYDGQMKALSATEAWGRLRREQQSALLSAQGLAGVPEIRTGTEAELLASLDGRSLDEWRTLTDALPQRFAQAQLAAAKLLQPEAAHASLPSGTLHTEQDLEAWLGKVRGQIAPMLAKGPVIISPS